MINTSFQFLKLVLQTVAIVYTMSILLQEGNASTLFTSDYEIKVSSDNMNCDYSHEDNSRLGYSFDYPKLISFERNKLIIAFIDVASQELILESIYDQNTKVIGKIPRFHNEVFNKWPTLYQFNNCIYVGVVENQLSKKGGRYSFKIYLFNNGKLNLKYEGDLKNERLLNKLIENKGNLFAIYPFEGNSDRFILFGNYIESHFHPLGIFSGDMPKYRKYFSISWKDELINRYYAIEENGWFGSQNLRLIISRVGSAYSTWVRNTSRVGIRKEHDEMVCYSEFKNENGWRQPIKIYSRKGIKNNNIIRDLSLACYNSHCYLLWQDIENGYYFSEIHNYKKSEMISVNYRDQNDNTAINKDQNNWGSNSKIIVDDKGNIYVLWVSNSYLEYKINLKKRTNMSWSESTIIGRGFGNIRQPDMIVDNQGVIHIVFIKKTIKEGFGCYYIKVKQAK